VIEEKKNKNSKCYTFTAAWSWVASNTAARFSQRSQDQTSTRWKCSRRDSITLQTLTHQNSWRSSYNIVDIETHTENAAVSKIRKEGPHQLAPPAQQEIRTYKCAHPKASALCSKT
jgi:hypothetical protein